VIEPEHPKEKYIQGRISFHETQAVWFQQNDQIKLADWARAETERWRAKLREKGELGAT